MVRGRKEALLDNSLAHNTKKIGEGMPQVVKPKRWVLGLTFKLTYESMVNRVWFPTCTFKADPFWRDILSEVLLVLNK